MDYDPGPPDYGAGEQIPEPLPRPPVPPRRPRRVREGLAIVLLFIFACAVAGFVLFVYLQPDTKAKQPGDTPTLPVPTTVLPAPAP